MNEDDVMLTTYDNPFNPFTDFERWWKEDLLLGHDCCGKLAKTALTVSIASDEINRAETLRAIDEIVSSEPMIYRKATSKTFQNV